MQYQTQLVICPGCNTLQETTHMWAPDGDRGPVYDVTHCQCGHVDFTEAVPA